MDPDGPGDLEILELLPEVSPAREEGGRDNASAPSPPPQSWRVVIYDKICDVETDKTEVEVRRVSVRCREEE